MWSSQEEIHVSSEFNKGTTITGINEGVVNTVMKKRTYIEMRWREKVGSEEKRR